MILNPQLFCFQRSPLHAAIWYATGSPTSGAGGGARPNVPTTFLGSPR